MQVKIVPVTNLKEPQIRQMFRLFARYYEHVTDEIFRQDLAEKQKVILLFGPDQSIVGFSTILQQKKTLNGQTFVAVFTGDTVLEKEFWGNGALAIAFGRVMALAKLENLFTPVYWFLISKGYKTYLQLTNNMPCHYPRFESQTPRTYQNIMNGFYADRFGDRYNPDNGLIRMKEDENSFVKRAIVDITAEDRENPRIAYFEKRNPQWHEGVELACLGKMTLWTLFRFLIKRLEKRMKIQKKNENVAVHRLS